MTYTLEPSMMGYSLVRSDGASIPADFGNVDFQAFLRWLSEGNQLSGLPAQI